jgi:hypothetical protein
MNPRRENGSVFVNPMTSGVSNGSAVIGGSSAKLRAGIQQSIFGERKPLTGKKFYRARRNKFAGEWRQKRSRKKQGRRRSMPPTTLPAPDIEIGPAPS